MVLESVVLAESWREQEAKRNIALFIQFNGRMGGGHNAGYRICKAHSGFMVVQSRALCAADTWGTRE
jgi:hypothetical protein